MKKIILATTLLVTFSISSFAGEKDADRKLLSDLAATLKYSTQVRWISQTTYNAAAFMFNEKNAYAFYNLDDNELVGFGIKFRKADLPGDISGAIDKKYSDWEIVDAMAFIDADGYINYFAQVQKNKKNLALKITPNGSLSVYAKMFIDK